jgi:hypothetical protein
MKARIALVLLAAFCSESVHADVLTLAADKDTSIFQGSVNNSLGGGPAIFVGTNSLSTAQRAFISFDLSSIPAGATISAVSLTLTLGQVPGGSPGTATIGLFAATRSWGEGTVGSISAGISGTGNGFAADAGDATWNAAVYPGTLWTTAGGDHAATASAPLFLGNKTVNNPFTWLSTPQLVADVQGWLTAPGTNFGWELINANESAASTQYGFYSREWSNAHFGGSASQVPALQVTYTVPETGTSVLLAAATAACFARRRRHARAA